eukprot:scaffold626_cov337-Pavlova_lutheri.AAC.25
MRGCDVSVAVLFGVGSLVLCPYPLGWFHSPIHSFARSVSSPLDFMVQSTAMGHLASRHHENGVHFIPSSLSFPPFRTGAIWMEMCA